MSEMEDKAFNTNSAPFYYSVPRITDNEIDLRAIFSVLWAGKWWIVLFMLFSVLLGGSYILFSHKIYESQVLVAPIPDEQQMGMASVLNSQFGGLASLAGINLGKGNADKTILALQVLQSRKFIGGFIQRHNLMVPVMAINGWDKDSGEFYFKTNIYDPENKRWLIEDGESLEPTILEATQHFLKKIMTVDLDSNTGMVTVTVRFYSPHITQRWATWLIADLNDEIRQQDMLEAQSRIAYLNNQLNQTSLADSRNMLYQLIEQQTKTLMLTKVSKEYVFKTVDPAVVDIDEIRPKKIIVMIASVIVGLFLGMSFIFIRHQTRK
ncbi:Wzz/FepE/Etk N-terminal domain-containing protein [Vibrio ruber]|uniref:Wzz/FepE/Etk N-terminal domain-containing protein n=1 Tax=Vibrio ruber TaxID=184755 RepID=UPI00289305EB|nr:Wzz/FepE/Etk N-terminal domain-containing protein [Vibrio ruber]WNJ96477.1 Wzz/FepE/Etk N-terminal domain-containing protein [Vibrio ruber]